MISPYQSIQLKDEQEAFQHKLPCSEAKLRRGVPPDHTGSHYRISLRYT